MLALGLAPAALIFLQPDLGTGVVLLVVTLTVLFLAGVRWTHFAVLGGVAAVAATFALVIAPAAGVPILRDYQQERLTSFLNPSDDPGDSSYQINQSLIAVGAGGKTGRGDQASQTELEFLPERHTDFVFAVIGERFGFLGAAFVLSLYALLIWRALRILTLSKNLYGTLIAGGIAAMLMFQILVNVGMNLGIMPVTGITLPLMSYGGSSVLVTFLAIGLLQSIHVQAQLDVSRQQGTYTTVALRHREPDPHTNMTPPSPASGGLGVDARVLRQERPVSTGARAAERKENHEEEHPRKRRPGRDPGRRARGERGPGPRRSPSQEGGAR